MRILRNNTSRFEPLNRQKRVGLGVFTPPRPSDVSSMPGGGVRTPSPTFRFVGSLHLQQSDAHWDHEPPRESHRFKAFMDGRKAILGRFESLGAIPLFMGSRHGFTTAHRGQEPKAPASRTHSKRSASFWNVETARPRLECVELAPAFAAGSWVASTSNNRTRIGTLNRKVQSLGSAGVLAGVLQLENLAGKNAGAPMFGNNVF